MDNQEKLYDMLCNVFYELAQFKNIIVKVKEGVNPDAYYTVKELSELLKVSKRTLQTWRDKDQIVYIQIKKNGEESSKGTVYFQGIDVINFLNSNKNEYPTE